MFKNNSVFVKIMSVSMIVAFMFVSGCAGDITEQHVREHASESSVRPMLDQDVEHFNDSQLISVLTQGNTANITGNNDDKLNQAFSAANKGDEATAKAKRAQIQDRLIIASNSSCNVYKAYLKQIDININESLGILTTVFSGAGALITGTVGKIFQGVGSASTSAKTQLIQSIFSTFTTSVIVPCIDKKRAELYQGMLDNRTLSMASYTVEGAIADVIKYHGACSLDTGIACAQESVTQTKNSSDMGIQKTQDILQTAGSKSKLTLQ